MRYLFNRLTMGLVVLVVAGLLSVGGIDLFKNTTAQMICAGLMLVGVVIAILPDRRARRP